MEANEFGYPLTLQFPDAKMYAVIDVLNFISGARYPCKHSLTTAPKQALFYSSKWSNDVEDSVEQPTHEHMASPVPGAELVQAVRMQDVFYNIQFSDVCEWCAGEREKTNNNLIERLLEAVNERMFELWDSFGGKATVPPVRSSTNEHEFTYKVPYVHRSNSREIYKTPEWWARMGYIYKPGLIKFCEREMICAQFEFGGEQAKSKIVSGGIVNGNTNTPKNIQQGQELVSSSKDVFADLIDQTNLGSKLDDVSGKTEKAIEDVHEIATLLSTDKPWTIVDIRDPAPKLSWYISARYFARQLVKEDALAINNRPMLAKNVVKLLVAHGIYKRGGKKPFDPGTVLKAFSQVIFK